VLDGRSSITFKREVIILPDEQLGVVHDLPILTFNLLQRNGGAFEGIESPIAPIGTRDSLIGHRPDLNVRLRR
jgi:hypothetical protein